RAIAPPCRLKDPTPQKTMTTEAPAKVQQSPWTIIQIARAILTLPKRNTGAPGPAPGGTSKPMVGWDLCDRPCTAGPDRTRCVLVLQESSDGDRLIRHLGPLLGLATGELQLHQPLADPRVRLAMLMLRRRGPQALVPRIRRVAHRRPLEQLRDVPDEARAVVLGGRVQPGVHPDRVLGAGVRAESADDAAQLVGDGLGRVFLGHPALGRRVDALVLPGLDEDALRRADGGAHVAGHAARLAVVPGNQPVQPAVPGRVRRLL